MIRSCISDCGRCTDTSSHPSQSGLHDLIIELRSMTLGVGTFQWQFDHLQELSGKEADDVVSERAAALAEH